MRIGQRLEDDAVHHAEDGGRPADAKCQRQDGYGGEAPIAAQLAQAIADVPCEALHKVSSAYCANPLLHLLDTANFDERFSSGHGLRKPLLHLFFCQVFQR